MLKNILGPRTKACFSALCPIFFFFLSTFQSRPLPDFS